MKLLGGQVTNYKSIDDSGWVTFENVTCLVGKNEAGKTAFLQALQKLSPVDGAARDFNPVLDYPRKGWSRYKQVHESSPAIVVMAKFELMDTEIQQIEAVFGEGILRSRTVTASKDYQNKRQWQVDVDEQAAVRHLLSGAGLPPDVIQQAKKAQTITELTSLLEGVKDTPPSVETLLTTLRQLFQISVEDQIINNHLNMFVPLFVYFNDYSVMRGSISIQNMRRRVEQGTLEEADQTFLALLSQVGIKLEELDKNQNYERGKADLEAAAISITDEVFEFWSQNKQLRVDFDLSNAEPTDQPPLNNGTILHVRIWNDRHRVSVPFDERSRGFVWFFSFLAYFSQIERQGRGLVLLLDEPGLSLHAKAQGDFVRFIEERLAPKHQVIYTTHSPFMVNPAQLHRVRTVQDLDGKGTIISDDVLRNDRDTIFPLQAAMGYELTQSLFVGPNCLLVEGPSDLIYLQILSEVMAAKGRAGLDPRWVYVPVGGADKISTFVSLLGANKLNIAVLMDVSTKDRQRIQNLQANALLGRSSLVQISDLTGTKEADIEDLFAPDFYLKLVNRAYASELSEPLNTSRLPAGNPRIVKRVEAYFKNEGIANGQFSHYRPAVYLLQEQQQLLKNLDDTTVDRAEALFERVNTLLPKRAS